eukprot:359270-Chlamydomonas_euryale.AAC.5
MGACMLPCMCTNLCHASAMHVLPPETAAPRQIPWPVCRTAGMRAGRRAPAVACGVVSSKLRACVARPAGGSPTAAVPTLQAAPTPGPGPAPAPAAAPPPPPAHRAVSVEATRCSLDSRSSAHGERTAARCRGAASSAGGRAGTALLPLSHSFFPAPTPREHRRVALAAAAIDDDGITCPLVPRL